MIGCFAALWLVVLLHYDWLFCCIMIGCFAALWLVVVAKHYFCISVKHLLTYKIYLVIPNELIAYGTIIMCNLSSCSRLETHKIRQISNLNRGSTTIPGTEVKNKKKLQMWCHDYANMIQSRVPTWMEKGELLRAGQDYWKNTSFLHGQSNEGELPKTAQRRHRWFHNLL